MYDPKPIPLRAHDWDFVHEDYDGPEDTEFHGGKAGSKADAVLAIREGQRGPSSQRRRRWKREGKR